MPACLRACVRALYICPESGGSAWRAVSNLSVVPHIAADHVPIPIPTPAVVDTGLLVAVVESGVAVVVTVVTVVFGVAATVGQCKNINIII